MKIAFADEVWGRLYGPYGNRSVNTLLQTLSRQWDNAVVQELCWEELHHQDDIYPATFAALPWLVSLSPVTGEGFRENYLFLSHVIHCACYEGEKGHFADDPRGKYKGLSTDVSDHQHAWIPKTEWLTAQDQPTLIKLEQWFSDNCQTIAERCLTLVGSDPEVSAYAIAGFAALNGSPKLASCAQLFAVGEDVDDINREMGGSSDENGRCFPNRSGQSARALNLRATFATLRCATSARPYAGR